MIALVIKDVSGEEQSLRVNPYATIRDLKEQISQLFAVGPSQIELSSINGQTMKLDRDQKTVSDYGLRSGSIVILLIKKPTPIQVFVKNEKGQTKTYDITEEETVDQLMMKVHQKEGISQNQQRLIYNGQQLDSGRKLQDYNIESGSTIYMTLRLRGG